MLALFYPLLSGAAAIVEMDNTLHTGTHIGHYKTYPG